MRKIISSLSFLLISCIPSSIFAQDCTVNKESLKGTYTGDCKNGKAHGKGKAVGTDTYDGDFKAGLPDGQGTYTWNNGNTFTGKFVKGLREGKGVQLYKRTNATDSLVEGYWKSDIYAGKNEKPYKVYFTSKSITQAEVEYKKDGFEQVTFFIANTSGGAIEVTGEKPKMKVDDVHMVKGQYVRMKTNDDHVKKSETILYDLTFPARMKVTIGDEQIDIEFFEEGSYIVNIKINQ